MVQLKQFFYITVLKKTNYICIAWPNGSLQQFMFSCVKLTLAVRKCLKKLKTLMSSEQIQIRASNFTESRMVYLITSLILVINLFCRHQFGGKESGKFSKINTISKSLLQFCGGGQVLLQAGLHPPGSTKETKMRKEIYRSSDNIWQLN